jgi:preprotein translocase subunit Sss1
MNLTERELMTWKVALVGLLIIGAIVLVSLIALAMTERRNI